MVTYSWLDNDGVQFMSETDLNDWLSSPKIIYTNVYGFSYTEADENSQPVSDLVAGNLLKIIFYFILI